MQPPRLRLSAVQPYRRRPKDQKGCNLRLHLAGRRMSAAHVAAVAFALPFPFHAFFIWLTRP